LSRKGVGFFLAGSAPTMAGLGQQGLSGHFGRDFNRHQTQKSGGYICQGAIFDAGSFGFRYQDTGNWIFGMGGIVCSVFVNQKIGVAVIGNEQALIPLFQG
jgi:hypothetical protein